MGYIFLGIPLTIFILFVLPIWLWLHYSGKKGVSNGQLTQQEMQRLSALVDKAQQMQERIKTLESILDAEHPNWRQS
ncbi:envelope stress response membrane protein PspB [Proteus myxofaciens]|uniref:Phage shock protein B n=1 Tax=Proteus myxofaciens ATCC 19692 TaxID=1354337 RepID=A0A198F9I9_9GAMM|nr:envelope stress response membrane protein PspB [Proteus myxofaciens]OAT21543.1 phage shock protein B [Proteus myxofaciens ATCC 19692]